MSCAKSSGVYCRDVRVAARSGGCNYAAGSASLLSSERSDTEERHKSPEVLD